MVRLDDVRRMEALGMGVAVCLDGGQPRRRSFVRYLDPASGRVWAVDLKASEYAELWDDELDPCWQALAGSRGEPTDDAGPQTAELLAPSPLSVPLLRIR